MRIEVGYGLEGTLTDALSKRHHRQRDHAAVQGGRFQRRHHARRRRHRHGADDGRLGVGGAARSLRLDRRPETGPPAWLLIAAFFGFVTLFAVSRGFRRLVNNVLLGLLVSSGGGRGGYSRGAIPAAGAGAAAGWRRLFRRWRIVGRRRRVGGLVMEHAGTGSRPDRRAIRAVEARTSARSSACWRRAVGRQRALPILLAALVALASPWVLVAVTELPVLADSLAGRSSSSWRCRCCSACLACAWR